MRNKGDKYKFTCLGIKQASNNFTLYRIKDDTGEDVYYENHSPVYLQKNVDYEATVVKRFVYKEIKVITVVSVDSIEDNSVRDKLLYLDEYVGVFDPPIWKLISFIRRITIH